jgi:hypothetical protein
MPEAKVIGGDDYTPLLCGCELLAAGMLKAPDPLVLFNTDCGLKYADVTTFAAHIRRSTSPP